MFCESFSKLSRQEQDLYIAKLNHAVKHNVILFAAGNRLIQKAEEAEVYEGVKFGNDEVYNKKAEPTTQY